MSGIGGGLVVVQHQARPVVVQQGASNANNVQSAPQPTTPVKVQTSTSGTGQLGAGALGVAIANGHPSTCNCPICSGNRAISFGGPASSSSLTSAKSRTLASGTVASVSAGDKMQAVKTPQSLSASIASVQTAAKDSAAQEAALVNKRAAEAEQTPSAEKTAAAQKNVDSTPVMGRSVKISVNLSSTAAVTQNTQTASARTAARASANTSNQTTTAAVGGRSIPSNTASSQNVQAQNVFSRVASANMAAANTGAVQQNTVSIGRASIAGAPAAATVAAPANASNSSVSNSNIAISTIASARTGSVPSSVALSSSAANIAAAVNSFNSAATGGMSARILSLFSEVKNFDPAQNNAALTANLSAGEKAIMQKPVPINLAFVQAGLTNTAVLTGLNGEKLVVNAQQKLDFGIAVKEARVGGLVFGEAAPKETRAASQPIISFAELSRIAHERDVQKENLSKLINLLFGKIMHKEEDDEDLEGMYGVWRDYLERQREQKDQQEKEKRRKKKQKQDAELQEEELEAVMAV